MNVDFAVVPVHNRATIGNTKTEYSYAENITLDYSNIACPNSKAPNLRNSRYLLSL